MTAEPVLAVAVARSHNKKVGACAATYAAQASCPSSCAFFDGGGCYAENGLLYSGTTRRLNEAARLTGASPLDVALAEADAIDGMEAIPGRPMRLHTVGDCRTDECARVVSAACARYCARGGGPCWTYTHAWRVVARESWGDVSVLASCETAEHVVLARSRGYAPAVVVREFRSDRLHDLDPGQGRAGSEHPHDGGAVQPGSEPSRGGRGLAGRIELCADRTWTRDLERPPRVLPCPQMTRGVTCADCRLCMDDRGILGRGYAIGFEVHGTAFSVRQARAALDRPHDGRRRLTSRQLIPEYLAAHPGASNTEIAAELGMNETSVSQMRQKLAA